MMLLIAHAEENLSSAADELLWFSSPYQQAR